MLAILVLIGLLLYCGLYYVWSLDQATSYQPFSSHQTLIQMIWMPQETIFMILRGLLLIAIFYLVADYLLSSARRGARRRRDKPDNEMKLTQTFVAHPDADADDY